MSIVSEPGVVELAGIAKSFGSIDVLTDISMSARRGRSYAIMGPSGSGKSTLLSIMGLLAQPSRGSVAFYGVRVPEMESARARLRHTMVGWVFQKPVVIPGRTALDNVCVPQIIRGTERRKAQEIAREALREVGLEKRTEAGVATLSGGELQRVEVARALACRPKLLLSDEPTANLDWSNAESVTDALLLGCDRGSTVIVATHDPRVAARCDEIVNLVQGRLCPR